MPDRLEEYLRVVQEQVRWKRAREGLVQELRTHLLDQRDDCLAHGMSEEEAQQESIRQMGDPVEVGTALDRIHRPKPQWGLLALIGMLLCMGYVAQTLLREVSQSLLWGVVGGDVTTFYETRWLMSAVIGSIIMLVVYYLDYTVLARYPIKCFSAGCLLFVIVFFNSHKVSGRAFEIQYWMLMAPVLLAVLLYGVRGKGWRGFLAGTAATLGLTALACIIPNLTLVVLILGTGCVLLGVAVVRGWLGISVKKGVAALAGVTGVLAIAFGYAAVQSPYVSRRILLALHPELDPLGKGYHATVIRSLLADARWIGQGSVTYGDFESAERLLPSIPTDSMLTWVIHRLGWAAGIAVAAAFVWLLYLMAKKALRQRGMLGCLISVAVVAEFSIQVLLYVVFNLGFCLLGPLPLPFISYGNAFMIVHMILTGLVLSVFRGENIPWFDNRTHKKVASTASKLIFWQDGDLVIGFSRLGKTHKV